MSNDPEMFKSMRRIGIFSIVSGLVALIGATQLLLTGVSQTVDMAIVGVLIMVGVGFLLFSVLILRENKQRQSDSD